MLAATTFAKASSASSKPSIRERAESKIRRGSPAPFSKSIVKEKSASSGGIGIPPENLTCIVIIVILQRIAQPPDCSKRKHNAGDVGLVAPESLWRLRHN